VSEMRVAIAGTGRMAETMAAALARLPGARVVAIASGSAERAAEAAGRLGVGRHGALPEVLAGDGIDLVYVANRSRDHGATSLAALRAGKAVLCEKPLALSAAEIAALQEAAGAAGVFCMEALWTAFLPAYRRIAAELARGAIGTPRQLRFDFGYPVTADERDRLLAAEDGGLLFDRAGYGVLLALLALGPVSAVQVQAPEGAGAADLTLALTHAGGGLSQIAVSATALLSNTAWIGGDAGGLALGPPSLAAEAVQLRTMAPVAFGPPGRGLKARLKSHPSLRRLKARLGGGGSWQAYGADPYLSMLAHVAETLAAGRTASEILPLSRSAEIAGILDRARQALGARP